jgi:hypothetical protein
MDNSYFIFTDQGDSIKVQRFHICTWEFRNNSALVEFGCEITADSLQQKKSLDLTLFIPWYNNKCIENDFYSQLKDPDNSRFIFNDSIRGTKSLDIGSSQGGVVHEFSGKNKLCILPIVLTRDSINHQIKIRIDLNRYNQYQAEDGEAKPNVYVRFSVKPNLSFISTRKKGINKSTIIYDIKLNERRNIPEKFLNDFGTKVFCDIINCFCFNIIPNSYDLVFFDNSSLQNVRTLEYESFNRYLGDGRIKRDELIVIFNKKKKDTPFSFFAIYSKERIGAGQYALAILINFISGIFLFIPAFRKSFKPELTFRNVWSELPIEIFIALFISLVTIILFAWPSLVIVYKKVYNLINSKRVKA